MRIYTNRWWKPLQRGILEPFRRKAVAILLAVMLFGFAQAVSKAGQESVPAGWGSSVQNPFQDLEGIDPALARRQLRALNAERQKELVADTVKLLKLAQELDAEVEAENKGKLSPRQLNNVGRIEKLARGVKQKMIETYGGGPVFRPPTVPRIR